MPGDFGGSVDIPMGFEEVDELAEGFVGVSLFGKPVDGFGADDVGGEVLLGAFVFAVTSPAGFVADFGVVVGAKSVVESVVIQIRDVVFPSCARFI